MTAERSAMGRRNRTKGYDAERAVARYLRDSGLYPLAITSRAALGHGGTHQPSDVIGVPGVAIEVKSVRGLSIGSALVQAELQGPGKLPVVVAKPIGVGLESVGNWFAITWMHQMVGLWPEGGEL
jgi:hypothetical protein